MRCKVGDLAVVTRAHPGYAANIGRLGTIRERFSDPLGYCDWWVEPATTFLGWNSREKTDGETKGQVSFPDDCLRPLRGDEGRDESLDWAPVPENPYEEVSRLLEKNAHLLREWWSQ